MEIEAIRNIVRGELNAQGVPAQLVTAEVLNELVRQRIDNMIDGWRAARAQEEQGARDALTPAWAAFKAWCVLNAEQRMARLAELRAHLG